LRSAKRSATEPARIWRPALGANEVLESGRLVLERYAFRLNR
jgi:hypothetical protein